ncbi:type II toxin-antitoxin system PemK/MazF family toxin [Pontibacter toksunensis]|uniref:Type II toxin-antitoxin system PemK/MazF family toxin n=1 Tax=Pontibacter toksunensis TaxID=1332631 RepID=A0ABW6BTI7_9BACT
MTYNRGDIIWVKFPFSDLTQTKKRPALIVSNDSINKTGDYILVQITSKFRNDGLSLYIDNDQYEGTPLQIKSYVRPHKIFTLNESLIMSKETTVKELFLLEVHLQIFSYMRKDFEGDRRKLMI